MSQDVLEKICQLIRQNFLKLVTSEEFRLVLSHKMGQPGPRTWSASLKHTASVKVKSWVGLPLKPLQERFALTGDLGKDQDYWLLWEAETVQRFRRKSSISSFEI